MISFEKTVNISCVVRLVLKNMRFLLENRMKVGELARVRESPLAQPQQ
jgi:hypothetical protein